MARRAGNGRVYPRGGQWWIDYSDKGEQIREWGGATKAEAEATLRQKVHERDEGRLVRGANKVTFEVLRELVETDYKMNDQKSLRTVRASFNNLAEAFGKMTAPEITTTRIKRYIVKRKETINKRSGKPYKNATIQKEIAALKRGFNLAMEEGLLSLAPHIPNVKVKGNARKGFWTTEEVDTVCEHLPATVANLVRFAYLTGWRRSEIRPLRWNDVFFDMGEVRLWDSKNDEHRVFPFAADSQLGKLLDERHAAVRALEKKLGTVIPFVFPREDGAEMMDRALEDIWDAGRVAAGLRHKLFHDFRRSAVRNMVAVGIAQSVAMKLSGHLTAEVFRRYAIDDAATLSEATAKLDVLHKAPRRARTVLPLRSASSGS